MISARHSISLLLVIVSCGCVSAPNGNIYLSRRAKDFSDIGMLGVGYGYGAHIKAYTMLLPVSYGYSRTREFGWDGRSPVRAWSWYRKAGGAFLLPIGFADTELISSRPADWEEFLGDSQPTDCEYFFVNDSCALQVKAPVMKASSGDERYDSMLGLEVTAGVASARLGIDPVQLVDFILGFFNVDFENDDQRGSQSSANPASEDTARKLAEPLR